MTDHYNGHDKRYMVPGMRRPFKYKEYDVSLGWKSVSDRFVWVIHLEKDGAWQGCCIYPNKPLGLWRLAIRRCIKSVEGEKWVLQNK